MRLTFHQADRGTMGRFAWAGIGAGLLYFLVQWVARLLERRWIQALFAFLRFAGLFVLTVLGVGAMRMHAVFGHSEDHFADQLTIPPGIEIAEPDAYVGDFWSGDQSTETDEYQAAVRGALAAPGGQDPTFTPRMPSLRIAATQHEKAFRETIEASPDWHVFIERGSHFAARRWSNRGEPRDTLHGYLSDFRGETAFQIRCLLCLDRKPWGGYAVQQVEEGPEPIRPQMTRGNKLEESRLMIECGGVWVEIFEQSDKPERRVTKATVAFLEEEFREFVDHPEASLAAARRKSMELARRSAAKDGQPFRLLNGMQLGIYEAVYSLNPGAPGTIYLKAYEVTRNTALSADRLERASATRMTWSADPSEKFGAKAGFTIYEGDWGKPYAARFEVWFRPDAGQPERKLAERIFKIEGWQR